MSDAQRPAHMILMTYEDDIPGFNRNDFVKDIAKLAMSTWDNDTPWVSETSLNAKRVSAIVSLDYHGLAVSDRGDRDEFIRIVRNRKAGNYNEFTSTLGRTSAFGSPIGVTIHIGDGFPHIVIAGRLLEGYVQDPAWARFVENASAGHSS